MPPPDSPELLRCLVFPTPYPRFFVPSPGHNLVEANPPLTPESTNAEPLSQVLPRGAVRVSGLRDSSHRALARDCKKSQLRLRRSLQTSLVDALIPRAPASSPDPILSKLFCSGVGAYEILLRIPRAWLAPERSNVSRASLVVDRKTRAGRSCTLSIFMWPWQVPRRAWRSPLPGGCSVQGSLSLKCHDLGQ